jgi:hypothetical protein
MRVLLLAAVLTLACKRDKPTVGADPDEKKHAKVSGVVITKAVPRVGLRARDVRAQTTDFRISIGAGTAAPTGFQRTDHDERSEQVLAVANGIVTKLRVTYDVRDSTDNVGGGGSGVRRPLPVEGHTYVVEGSGAALDVHDEHGKTVPPTESALVRDDYRNFGREDELTHALPDGPIHVGDKLPELANAMKERLVGKSTLKTVGDVDVRVESANSDHVVFRVKATFAILDGSPMTVTLPLDGTVTVRVSDGWLGEYSFVAPMTMSSGDAAVAFSGSGNLTMTAKRSYF